MSLHETDAYTKTEIHHNPIPTSLFCSDDKNPTSYLGLVDHCNLSLAPTLLMSAVLASICWLYC